VLERTLRELQGQSCIDLEAIPSTKKQIAYTRSFGQPVRDLLPLTEVITEFTSRAAEKLRQQQSLTSAVLVYMRTGKHRPGPQYNSSITVPLVRPVSDTRILLVAALQGLKTIYKPGYDLIKAGVILMDLTSSQIERQAELNFDTVDTDDKDKLMQTIDRLNGRFGRGTVTFGSTGLDHDKRQWSMNQQNRSPGYTTILKEIPIALA
jgi:DNA polymerase V